MLAITEFASFFSLENLPVNLTALRKAKIVCNFGLSECNRVKGKIVTVIDSHRAYPRETFETTMTYVVTQWIVLGDIVAGAVQLKSGAINSVGYSAADTAKPTRIGFII